MKADQPSRTAQRVARRRAAHQLLDAPPVFEDPLAIAVLGPETAAALRADPEASETGPVARYFRAFMAARSRFAEDRLVRAVERGARQYVVLGAGLDTFAYRNPHAPAGLRVFEVDHPATQAWKRERLREAGIAAPESLTFVGIDFASQALSEALPAAGWRAGLVTFFSWLGVIPYLERDRILATLRLVATAAPGSEIVFDYGRPPSSLGFGPRIAFEVMARRVAAVGEPWITFFEPDELGSTLRAAGFSEVDDFAAERINALYFEGRKDGLRVGGIGHLMWARV